MNISSFCIRHPVATILMSLSLIFAGLFAYKFLPVAALPRAEFPVVNVSASLPGASPDTMATSVAIPLIKQFATISGIDSISTSNSQGTSSIAIQFVLNRNIDAAAADVQAAIARAQKQLPIQMTSPPSYKKVNPADAPILLLALKSENVPLTQLDAFSQQVISPALSTVDGVAQVSIYGSQKYAVRIQIDPTALAARGIGIDELQAAVTAANDNTPVGTLSDNAQQLTLEAKTQLANAAQFSNIIISNKNGHPVRLGDVTHVIDSVENNQTASWYDGSRAIILAVQRQPDANTVEVVDRVRALLPGFQAQLPGDTTIEAFNDRSTSVRSAVDDIQFTLGLTIALVILVVFLFLRKISATLIPALAVPISLISTLAVMYMLGFSIDNISLLGLTLSVGLVVDDAIVMLENIVRHVEEDGMSSYEAALKGSREVGFTILSISISLVAVFIPILLMGGVIGRVFNEFAVVVSVSILASAFVSLTLTPMLCARMSDHPHDPEAARKGFGGWLEAGFDKMLAGYDAALKVSLRFQPVILVVFFLTLIGTVWLFQSAPKGFFPQEDIGQLSVSTEARQDISFDAMTAAQAKVETVFRTSPYVAHVASSVGGGGGGSSGMNSGRFFVELKPLSQRPALEKVLVDLRKDLTKIAGINTYMTPVQNLNLGARASKSQYQLVVQGLNQDEMNLWAQKLTDAMATERNSFVDVTNDQQNNALQATLVIDRDKASELGIDASTIRATLYAGFGALQISTIFTTGDSYAVLIEFDPRTAWTPDRLEDMRVRSKSGTLIALSSFATIKRTAGHLTVNQLGQLPAVTISYNLPAGVALGDSVTKIAEIKNQIGMPVTISTAFAGTAKTFQDSLANQGLLIGAAIATIYIVLGILYESFVHPLTILTGLPAAAIGALGALRLFNLDLSVIAIIGLLMLIGIVKKNAIMMIDVALELQRSGVAPREAIHRACLLRFRPIMMTSIAAMMGALPLALGTGASAELRQPLGIAVCGGLIVSQALTLLITPVLYLYMERLSQFLGRLIGSDKKPPESEVLAEHTA